MKKINFAKIKKITTIILVFTLVLGVLSSTFGITVLALGRKGVEEVVEEITTAIQGTEETFVSPTEGYNLPNEIGVKDDVIIFTEEESNEINSAIISVDTTENYYGITYTKITILGEDLPVFDNVYYNNVIFLQGDVDTPLGESKFLKIEDYSSYNGETYITTSEPRYEEVFDSMSVASSTPLTEENFVQAYYPKGVSGRFGDVATEMSNATETKTIGDEKAQTLAAQAQESQCTQLADDYSIGKTDLILTLDYNFAENAEGAPIDASFGITGEIGITDLQAHMVCDIPNSYTYNELYFGISGEIIFNVDFNGEVSFSSEAKARKTDLVFVSIEGLNEKRFPIAVFQFKGTTPVYITNKQFKDKLAILPSIYIIFYADWEGEISVEASAGFEYTHSFNSGIRVVEDGKFGLSYENYPYVNAAAEKNEDKFLWHFTIEIEANSEVTLLGGSVLFYIAGINLAEVSIVRLGAEVEGKLKICINSENKKLEVIEDGTYFYLRGFLKILEVKVKIKVEGESLFDDLSIDRSFEFSLLDITLFEIGECPDKYKPKVPVSSMTPPTQFESVITLVCDVSGSMGETIETGQRKIQAAKEAGKTIVSMTESWANNNNNGNFGIGIVKFDDSAETVAVPHVDYHYLNQCILTLDDNGGTCIYTGIDAGVAQLESVESSNKVIVLMTDGQDSASEQALESAKKAAKKGIKIYTIGFGSGVNKELLKEIARITDGEYKYADTKDIVGIVGSFMYAQQATNADVLVESQGTVAEGETSHPEKFTVSDKSGNLTVSTAWPGSFLDTILIDPNGKIVDENYPGAVIDESKIPSTIIITNPLPGQWSISVKGIETSYEHEPYYTIVSFKETEAIALNEPMSKIDTIVAYCVPIGLFATITSTMLLVVINKKKDDEF